MQFNQDNDLLSKDATGDRQLERQKFRFAAATVIVNPADYHVQSSVRNLLNFHVPTENASSVCPCASPSDDSPRFCLGWVFIRRWSVILESFVCFLFFI